MRYPSFILLMASCSLPAVHVQPLRPCSHTFTYIDENHIDMEIKSELPEVDVRITELDGSEINLTVRKEFYRCRTVGVGSDEVIISVQAETYCIQTLKR